MTTQFWPAPSCDSAVVGATVNAEAVDAVLRAAVASGHVPDVVVVAGGDRGVVYEGAVGTGLDSVFRIASMTKIVTTAAALQLLERGRLDLDSPVHRYVPEFADLQVLTGFDDDVPVLRPPASQATVRQLMTHTSGLGYWFFNVDLFRWHRITGTPNVVSGRVRAFGAPMVTDPGNRLEYGISTDWLGRVVEAASGQRLDGYLEEHLTGPLGMADTTFHPDAAQRARLVPVRVRDAGADDGWAVTGIDWPRDPEWWAGGHGLHSTPRDFVRFLRALLDGGTLDGVRVLAEESVEQVFTNQIGDLFFPEHLPTAHPASSADLDLGPGLKWGLGLLLSTRDAPGRRAAGSGSWSGIHNTHFWIDRRRRLTGAFFTQFLPFADPSAMRAFAAVETALYASW